MLVNVGAPADPLSLSVATLLGKRRSFAGSATGGIAENHRRPAPVAAAASDIDFQDRLLKQLAAETGLDLEDQHGA